MVQAAVCPAWEAAGRSAVLEERCALTWRQGTSQEVPRCPDEGVESFRCIFMVGPTGLQD